jgi:VanZ family protein
MIHSSEGSLMKRLLTPIAAWVFLALIAFWTLGPVEDRPRLGPPQLERFGAYFVLGALFAYAYARPRLVAVSLAIVAVGLELGQLFVPGRDAGVPDAIAKALGAIAGVAVVAAAQAFVSARRRSETHRPTA